MKNTIRLSCAVAFVVAAVSALAPALRADILEAVLVKVNGDIFTKSELESRQVQVLRQKGENFDLKGDAGAAQLRKALDDVTPQIIVDVVDEMLLVQRGRELGYKMSDDQFKTAVDSIKKDNKIETEEQFQSALKQEGMTMADLRRNFERQWIRSRVEQNEVLGKVAITDEEARKYYQEHVSEFTSPPSVTLREILVAVAADPKGINVGLDEVAKEKAASIRARAVAGEAFEKLASDVSDAPSRANAGLIGPISSRDLSPDFQKLIETMKVGDISQPLRTPRGYQILKLESTTGAQTLTFEAAREQISERVLGGKRQQEFLKLLDKLRGEASIEFKNADIKKAYDQGIAAQKQAVP